MLSLLSDVRNYLAYYHTSLSLNGEHMHLGRASHLQVFLLADDRAQPGITHFVRFYDGKHHRELLGNASVESDGDTVILDMGQGKVYRFIKQVARNKAN